MAIEALSPTAPAANTTCLANLMAVLDALEGFVGTRSGASAALHTAGLALETQIINTRAATAAELLWKVRRIARAIENDWTEEAAMPLVRSVEADVLTIATTSG